MSNKQIQLLTNSIFTMSTLYKNQYLDPTNIMSTTNVILIFGGTGKTGFHIANRLVSLGVPVRLFVRNKTKAASLYKQREIGFEKVIQGKIQSSTDMEQAFKASQHFGNIKYVISALGASQRKKLSKVEYDYQIKIIQACKKYNAEKYFFISAAYVDRGWNPLTVILNTIGSNMMYHKSRAQNYLRKSGMDYVIFRPPTLVGEYDNEMLTPYAVTQGYVNSGSISRYTLAKAVVDCLNSTDKPQKLTIQCSLAKKNNDRQEAIFSSLKPDNDSNIINTHHRIAKFVYWIMFVVFLWFLKGLIFGTKEEEL